MYTKVLIAWAFRPIRKEMMTLMSMTPQGSAVFALVACLFAAGLGGGTLPALGQSRTQGAYSATVKVAGTETGGETRRVVYKAEVKMNIPLTDGNQTRAIINVTDVDEPSAKVTISQWDLEERNASPNSDGKITSWKCRLTAPVTVPMMAAGVLNLDYRKRTYSMFLALTSMEDVPLSCVNSRTGPYTTEQAMGFFFGTTEIDTNPHDTLPLTDPARIAAKHTLVPKGEMKGQYLPQDQEWELVLKK
jgi:hypothetical protein